jgi:hypothetical protein
LWDGETARRYRRAQLHNLRHVKLVSAAAGPRRKPHNRLESADFVGVCAHVRKPNKIGISIEVGPVRVMGAR